MTIITVVTALSLTAGVAFANAQLQTLIETESSNTAMGAGPETSGATYNPIRNTLFTVDDGGTAHEFQLDTDGSIDQSLAPRELDLNTSNQDFEGIAWIQDNIYGLLSEDAKQVMFVDIDDTMTEIVDSDVFSSFQVAWGNLGNKGPEGLATDGQDFFVTVEMPATLSKFTGAGNFVATVDLFALADASGVAALSDGTYLVISDESRKVAHYDVNWNTEVATLLGTHDAGLFDQLEGIAVVGDTDAHIFGEDKPGQTYSRLEGQLVPTNSGGNSGGGGSVAIADVNCSGTVDVLDAVMVAQINSGIAQAMPGCGSGDHNLDGVLNIFDAVSISQCTVGIANAGCPDI